MFCSGGAQALEVVDVPYYGVSNIVEVYAWAAKIGINVVCFGEKTSKTESGHFVSIMRWGIFNEDKTLFLLRWA